MDSVWDASMLSLCIKTDKRTEISTFICVQHMTFYFLTETWLKPHGDEGRLHDLTPAGYIAKSFSRESRGGGIAVGYNKCLSKRISITATFCFHHQSFEVIGLFCVLFLFCFVALLLRRHARFMRAFNCPLWAQ